MKIAIEAMGIQNFGGGRSATFGLLRHLFEIDQQNQYTVVLSKAEPGLAAFGNVQQWIAPTTNRFVSRIWAQAVFPIRFRDYDLVHFAKNLGVWGLPVPYVVTIYDLTTLVYPQFFPHSEVLYWRTLEKWTARSARRVITISECTTRDVHAYFGVPEERIRTIYCGKSPEFRPRPTDEIVTVRARYGLPEDYMITVGRIDLKKNLTALVEAFSIVKEAGYSGKLVLVGEVYKKCEDKNLLPTIRRLGLTADVLLVGKIPDADLPAAFCGALAYVFPSLHEGFGLAALEAMGCGIPVICNNTSAITEVVGEAGLVVDATRPQALSEAMRRIIQDEELRIKLRQASLKQAEIFKWEQAACQTLAVYQECVAGRS